MSDKFKDRLTLLMRGDLSAALTMAALGNTTAPDSACITRAPGVQDFRLRRCQAWQQHCGGDAYNGVALTNVGIQPGAAQNRDVAAPPFNDAKIL